VITNGHRVSIEYILSLADGTIADSNVGGKPLTYEHGTGQILPALEKELLGLSVGDTRQVSLTAAEGYGEIDTSLFHTVPASGIPEDAREVGARVTAESASGERRTARVREIKGDEIVVDLNHPLAGQAIEFDIKILAIE